MSIITNNNEIEAQKRQAQDVIKKKIDQAKLIVRSFSESSDSNWQSTGIRLLAIIFLGLFNFAIIKFSLIIVNCIPFANYVDKDKLSVISLIGLYALCLYLSLYILKIIVGIYRTAKINSYIRGVDSIIEYLSNSAFDGGNFFKSGLIKPKRNIDSEIEEYQRISSFYSKTEDGKIDVLATIAYWISSLLFGFAFIIVTSVLLIDFIDLTNFWGLLDYELFELVFERIFELLYYLAEEIGDLLHIGEENGFSLIYAITAGSLFVVFNFLWAKKKHNFGFWAFILSLLFSIIAFPIFVIICALQRILMYLTFWGIIVLVAIGLLLLLIYISG